MSNIGEIVYDCIHNKCMWNILGWQSNVEEIFIDRIRPNVRKPGQFDSVSRNCSCAGVFKSLKPIFAENKYEIAEKN